jgi:hypothetical protein
MVMTETELLAMNELQANCLLNNDLLVKCMTYLEAADIMKARLVNRQLYECSKVAEAWRYVILNQQGLKGKYFKLYVDYSAALGMTDSFHAANMSFARFSRHTTRENDEFLFTDADVVIYA